MKFFTALAAVGITVSLSACNTDVALEDIDLTLEQANALGERYLSADSIPFGTVLPSSATMSGYVGVGSEFLGPFIVTGKLDMDANFAAATVTGTATNFVMQDTFDVQEPENDEFFGSGALGTVSRIDGSLELEGVISRNPIELEEDNSNFFEAFGEDGLFVNQGAYLAASLEGTLTGEFEEGTFTGPGGPGGTFAAEVEAELFGEFRKDDDGLLAAGMVAGYADVTPTITGFEDAGDYEATLYGYFAVAE